MYKSKYPWVTISITTINIIAYVFVVLNDESILNPSAGNLLTWGGNFSGLTLKGEWWRLLTSIFLHGNLIHLIFNIYAFISIGSYLEYLLGHFKFLGYYLIMGIGASMTSLLWNDFTISVGASGAIFGLFGFYFINTAFNKEKDDRFNRLITIIVTILGNLTIGFLVPFIDNVAHIGGLIVGMICAGILAIYKTNIEPFDKKTENYLFTFSSVICLSCYLIVGGTISKDRAAYYELFQKYIKTDGTASRIQYSSSFFTDPSYRSELDTAYNLWKDLKVELNRLTKANNTVAMRDRYILFSYARLRQKGIRYLQKIVTNGSFVFLDSLHLIDSKIEELPRLTYNLDFYPPIKEKDTLTDKDIFFDKDWLPTDNIEEAMYNRISRVDKLGRTQGWTYDFYSNSVLQMKGFYRDNLLDGITFYFYPNGKYESIGIMAMETKVGKWQYFYKNGQLKSEIMYNQDGKSEVLSFFDSTGTQLVFDGNGKVNYIDEMESIREEGNYVNYVKEGTWYGYYANGNPYFEETYVNGLLVKGKSVSPHGDVLYEYTNSIEFPRPAMGWNSYNRYIDSTIYASNYYSKNKGIVNLELFIDSLGKIKSMRPVIIIGDSCEERLISIIKKKPDFVPGLIRGQVKGMRAFVSGRF